MVVLKLIQERRIKMVRKTWPRALPTGECWCGCGAETPVGSFFLTGHDKRAESEVILTEYGSVPDFLLAHGYGPARRTATKRGRS
jgi:hypothetical protein